MNQLLKILVIVVFCGQQAWVEAQSRPYRMCTTSRFSDQCSQLQRGSSGVNCQRVQDGIECAQRLRNGTADFGIFGPETALLLASLKYDGLTVVKELRHHDRMNVGYDFESVVVVKANHHGGINGLKGLNYCHPGFYYDRNERWTERFLKQFERKVAIPDCDAASASDTPAKIETAAIAKLFGEACRPGIWSHNLEEDTELKKKYPQLCSLCSSSEHCEYETESRHIEALKCLLNKGHIAYVSSFDALNFFNIPENADKAKEHAYLCPNGTLKQINDGLPCTWLRQPWPVIISNSAQTVDISNQINAWMHGNSNWELTLKEIIKIDNFVPANTDMQYPKDYFGIFREVPYSQTLCSTQASWCTTSVEEKEKCEIVRTAGITTGAYPLIECQDPSPDTVACLNDINKGRADFTGIDSNFGFIARYPYNLTTALYAETENDKYASVVVVVRNNSTFERFENLRGAKACFAEFGSIASIAFINTGKNRGFFKKSQCHYGHLLSEFFGSSCAPGALDIAHDPKGKLDSLCSLCRPSSLSEISAVESDVAQAHTSPPLIHFETEIQFTDSEVPINTNAGNKIDCNAAPTNGFYGNQGALQCLHEAGDVAVLELQFLNEHAAALGINPNDYRIMCANGSLANRAGFDVDDNCPLTTIVDGEIVVSPQNKKTDGIINALISFDKYFQNDPDFKMYNIFSGHRNLLFKDSSLGLAARNEKDLNTAVENYKNLFKNLEECVQASGFKSMPAITIILVSFTAATQIRHLFM